MIKLILSLTITLSLSLPHSLLAKSGYEAALEVAQAKRVSKVVDNINILHKKINKYILEHGSLPESDDIVSVESYVKNVKVGFIVDDSKVRYSNIIPNSFDDTQKNLLRQSTSLDSLAVVNTNMTMDIALEPGVILFLEQKDSLSANEVLSLTPPVDTTKLWYQPNGQGGFSVKKYDGANWVVSIANTASSSAKKDDIIVKTKEELDKLKAKKGDKAYISKAENSISGYVYDGEKWLLESVSTSSKVADVCTASDIGIMKYNKDTNCMQSCQSDGSGGYAWECVEGGVASTEPVSSNNYNKTTPKVSCKAHLDAGATEDGIYKINPSGTVFDAYCDMTTDGGGWTKIIHGSDTTLDYLSHFGNTSNISSTFYTDSTKGIGWGTNDQYYKEFFIKDLKFNKYRVVFSGSYNSPSGGLGTLSICNATNQGKYWNQTTSGTISLFLNDGTTTSSDGQVLKVNGSTIFSGTQEDVLNRTEIISAYSPYITMTGYTSSYPYTKRYIKEFWVK